ncbi:MAG: YceI family protein [Nocardioidaceae bacterium]
MASSDPKRHHPWRWVAGAVGVLVILAVAVPYAYIHLIQGPAPKPLSLATTPPPSTPTGDPSATSPSSVDETWKVSSGSQAGYRVKEVLAGQPDTAVGRTSSISGSFELTGSVVAKGSFTVDLRTVTSDEGRRDEQFNGRIMDTAEHPLATYTLTKPIDLGSAPVAGKIISVKAAGALAMHGVTHPVTASIRARYTGSAFEISGSIPVTFEDWAIANPGFAGFVTTENHGIVEFLLTTTRA